MAGLSAGWYAFGPPGSLKGHMSEVRYLHLTARQAQAYAANGGVNVPGIPASYLVLGGPYPTRAAAQAAITPKPAGGGDGTDGTVTTSSGGGGSAGGGGGGIPWWEQVGIGAAGGAVGAGNPLGPVIGGFTGIGTFFSDITDPHMWISLGWIGLGLILFLIGIAVFVWSATKPLRDKANQAAAQIAAAA